MVHGPRALETPQQTESARLELTRPEVCVCAKRYIEDDRLVEG
jgi:hypothetical protein